MDIYSCELVKRFVVNHIPVQPKSETVNEVLKSYSKVVLTAGRPHSLLKDHRFFVGYDGQVVPIRLSAFSFICRPSGITGEQIISEVQKKGSFVQATGYELALLCRSPEFVEWIRGRQSEGIEQTLALSINENDVWKNHNGHWAGCVHVKGDDYIYRYFFAGENNILKHNFPIGGQEHLIIGVEK